MCIRDSIIIGTHPHVVQSIETVTSADGRQVPVAYSLGNFVSTQIQADNLIGIILTFDITKTTQPDGASQAVIDLSLIHILCEERRRLPNLQDKNALFVSRKTGKRLSARRVQQIVESCLRAAGLSGKGYSTHKLRHTAATMMYQEGHVDMLALKEILGHAHVSTTEIYTHLGSAQLKEAAKAVSYTHLERYDDFGGAEREY